MSDIIFWKYTLYLRNQTIWSFSSSNDIHREDWRLEKKKENKFYKYNLLLKNKPVWGFHTSDIITKEQWTFTKLKVTGIEKIENRT